jgi:hypothetical protein
MKKLIFALVILFGLIYSSSCSNDFDLTADWKDIPVVYAFLSRSDTAHYVRVEKAFLDPNTSALELAKVADSLYYPNAVVKLVRVSDNNEYVFTKVDGNLEGYPRDSDGPFATTPNWLYKLKTTGLADTLMPGEEYQLIVSRSEDATPVTSTITLVDDLEIKAPLFGAELGFTYNVNASSPKTSFRWSYNRDNTFLFDASLTFNYQDDVNGEWQDRSAVWSIVQAIEPEGNSASSSFTINLSGDEFYKFVAAALQDAPDVKRRFRYIDFRVTGANESYYQYNQVNKVNTGITSAQLIPNFTNLSEGFGLFASRHSVEQSHGLKLASRDSLIQGIYTRHLKFQ